MRASPDIPLPPIPTAWIAIGFPRSSTGTGQIHQADGHPVRRIRTGQGPTPPSHRETGLAVAQQARDLGRQPPA